ncbi:MAG: YIP1 family protein [Acidimicrobiales bacterium]
MTAFATFFRIEPASWQRNSETMVARAVAAVLVAFALLAWNRFGAQGVVAPRASVRLILIGVYGWLGASVALWAIARFTFGIIVPFQRTLCVLGTSHIPLVVLGGILQFAGVVFRWFLPGLIGSIVVFGLWMPAMLVAGSRHIFGLDTKRAATVVVVPYAGWLATVGVVLHRQLGHLI